MRAIITRPAKSAMQSGKAKSRAWVLRFVSDTRPRIEPLMGWTSAFDTASQVVLEFETREQAIAYAERRKIAYELIEPAPRTVKSQGYADNFRFDRKIPWSH